MSEFEKFLEQKAKDSATIDLSTLGDSFTAVILKTPEAKQDKRGNEAIYIELKTKDGLIVQKYGKSLYPLLLEKMKACSGLANLIATEHVWKQEKAGRATFNRYFPVPNKKVKA
jgi:hypothetical protein